jgi:hypothetical protein
VADLLHLGTEGRTATGEWSAVNRVLYSCCTHTLLIYCTHTLLILYSPCTHTLLTLYAYYSAQFESEETREQKRLSAVRALNQHRLSSGVEQVQNE